MTEFSFTNALKSLKADKARLAKTNMRAMFALDAKRHEKFSLRLEEMVFDYSKNCIDQNALKSLLAIAKAAGVEKCRDAMFSGEKINQTEQRSVLHTALRNMSGRPVLANGRDVMPDILKTRKAMARFANAVRSGRYKVTGGTITDVVNIGIGGSHLGPAMVTRALAPYHNGPRCHFVANVDGADLADTLRNIPPETTLFIVASKTFTTQETMANATTARKWLRRKLKKQNVGGHFAAVSANLKATRKFAIDDSRTFPLWDWVGGRYSVWSAIGLSVMLAIGPKHFDEFLGGAWLADKHFVKMPLAKNIPVIMALIGIWNRNVLGLASQAVLPYDSRLALFADYLQQLDMESNGKRISMSGKLLGQSSGPIIWGMPGTNGQHAFFQMLHQGTDIVPCDFLIAANPHEKSGDHHALLVANCLAQSEALMIGKTLAEVEAELQLSGVTVRDIKTLARHKVAEGNRPSNTFLYKKLDPETLGMLIAFYEHKVFVQGVIWGLNSFDQWGVELGKTLAETLVPLVRNRQHDRSRNGSTMGLLKTFHKLKKSK